MMKSLQMSPVNFRSMRMGLSGLLTSTAVSMRLGLQLSKW